MFQMHACFQCRLLPSCQSKQPLPRCDVAVADGLHLPYRSGKPRQQDIALPCLSDSQGFEAFQTRHSLMYMKQLVSTQPSLPQVGSATDLGRVMPM